MAETYSTQIFTGLMGESSQRNTEFQDYKSLFHCLLTMLFLNLFLLSAGLSMYRMLHMVTQVPLVRSVTHSVYEIGFWLENYYEQLNLIDGVFLDSDMKRLEPMTALYAPDADWRNKIIEVDNIEPVLENHLFEDLLWCHVLIDKAINRETIESLNGQVWGVSVNDLGMPCIDTIADSGEEVARSCITECDHLARNGIVHTVDKVVLSSQVETRGPTPALPAGARPKPIKPNPTGRPAWMKDEAPDDAPASYTRPKRRYEWDEFDDDAITDGAKSAAVTSTAASASFLAVMIPGVLLLLL